MIDLNELCKVTLANANLRNRNGGHIKTDTRSMLKHTATEVVEATEAYARYEYDDIGDEDFEFRQFKFELADIICCVLIIAGKEKIDIEQAIMDCIEKNRKWEEFWDKNFGAKFGFSRCFSD